MKSIWIKYGLTQVMMKEVNTDETQVNIDETQIMMNEVNMD